MMAFKLETSVSLRSVSASRVLKVLGLIALLFGGLAKVISPSDLEANIFLGGCLIFSAIAFAAGLFLEWDWFS